jgi:hypothetical protein
MTSGLNQSKPVSTAESLAGIGASRLCSFDLPGS